MGVVGGDAVAERVADLERLPAGPVAVGVLADVPAVAPLDLGQHVVEALAEADHVARRQPFAEA